jgi:hypothetical protein
MPFNTESRLKTNQNTRAHSDKINAKAKVKHTNPSNKIPYLDAHQAKETERVKQD